jgi:general secretion pathway protein E
MGVEPFLTASSLVAVLAQRLVRMTCPYCKEPYEVSKEEARYFAPVVSASFPLTLFRGKGCERCKGTGYLGRTGIFELVYVDKEARHLITGKANAQMVKDHAISHGMKTLYIDGLNKVVKGLTTLEEVMRVTQKDYADF